MTIEFHDGYTSRGFWFGEQMSNRRYCLSAGGEEGRNCVAAFRGSLAIARYRVRPRSRRPAEPVLREYVRTIDHDARLPGRPPFERTIELKRGMCSDLQAFGYEPSPGEECGTSRGTLPGTSSVRICFWNLNASRCWRSFFGSTRYIQIRALSISFPGNRHGASNQVMRWFARLANPGSGTFATTPI